MSSWDTSRRRKESSSTRLRMDSYNNSGGRASRSRATSKRRELDKVMKKARSRDGATQSNYWNKKLLEAEEKDPNRWRHSGYKELYGGGGGGAGSPQGSRDSHKRSRSRSRLNRGRRSPPPPARQRSRRPHTPPSNNPRQPGPSRRSPKAASLSPSSRSLSSCSDESCSVCSPKPKARKMAASPPPLPSRKQQSPRPRERKKVPTPPLPPARRQPSPRSRSRSFSVPRNRPSNNSPQPGRPPPRRGRERSGPPRDPRGPPPSPPPSRIKPAKQPRVKVPSKKRKSRSKSGRTKRRQAAAPEPPPPPPPAPRRRPRGSPAPSVSDDSSGSSLESGSGVPKLTLSERFGKMAQWSVDRRDLDGVRNMRITKESEMRVVTDRGPSPLPASERYPEALHAGPSGLDAWDEVGVRYKYYKDRGYLRDLTLDDYVKWEEWWYKYQEWLEAERYYARWEQLRGGEEGGGYFPRSRRSRRV